VATRARQPKRRRRPGPGGGPRSPSRSSFWLSPVPVAAGTGSPPVSDRGHLRPASRGRAHSLPLLSRHDTARRRVPLSPAVAGRGSPSRGESHGAQGLTGQPGRRRRQCPMFVGGRPASFLAGAGGRNTVGGITLEGGCGLPPPGAGSMVGKAATAGKPSTRNMGLTASEPRKRWFSRSGDCQCTVVLARYRHHGSGPRCDIGPGRITPPRPGGSGHGGHGWWCCG
jgi:hypothetical protein